MQESSQSKHSPSMASLFGDILVDLQRLIQQEVALVRMEVKEQLESRRTAVSQLLVGGMFLFSGIVIAALAISHYLSVFAHTSLELSYLIVGAVFLILGTVLFQVAKKNLEAPEMSLPAKPMNKNSVLELSPRKGGEAHGNG